MCVWGEGGGGEEGRATIELILRAGSAHLNSSGRPGYIWQSADCESFYIFLSPSLNMHTALITEAECCLP